MSRQHGSKRDVADYYDEVAGDYAGKYRKDALHTPGKYPNNYVRLQLLLNSMADKNLKRVIEVGVGEGTPLSVLARAGVEAWGFDISHKMVEAAKGNVKKYGIDPNHIFWGDITDPVTYTHVLQYGGQFDGLIAMGVMPHVPNDEFALENMATLVRPGGTVLIEFRNKLFSLFTFNRLTAEFIVEDLLRDVDESLKMTVLEAIQPRLQMELPPQDTAYESIPARYHNPFEVEEMFRRSGFTGIKFLWYHYHAAPPLLEKEHPVAFFKESLRLEHETSGWRGMFLCSAFVVEAIRRE